MPARVETAPRACQGAEWLAYLLEDTAGPARFEVWPHHGFWGASWQVWRPNSHDRHELLFTQPDRPLIQQGIPLLFPFPNRIRDGRFTWQGRDWQLPCNDPAGRNAIHGLVHDQPWQVTRCGLSAEGWPEIAATLTSASLDPQRAALWPGTFALDAGYRLMDRSLEFNLAVTNTSGDRLPFGVGLHPYWRLPPATTRVELAAGAAEAWQLDECLPTGQLRPLDAVERVLIDPGTGPLGDREFDQVFRVTPPKEKRRIVWRLACPVLGGVLTMTTSPSFRDFVLFTPPHRQAISLEPYTCVTDAINLHGKIWDKAKLLVLDPGSQWRGWVRWQWEWTT